MHPVGPVRFVHRGKYGYFTLGKQKLEGITKVLKEVFYPKYDFYKATVDHGEKTSSSYKHIKGSSRLGRGFDTAIGQCCRLFKKYPFLRIDAFVTSPKPYIARLSKPDARVLQRLNKRRNPYVKMFLQWLGGKGYRLVGTQVPVGHDKLRIATAADAVVAEGDVYHPLEFKCGYEAYLKKSTKEPMNAPFEKQADYPLNQHHIQMAITHQLYTHTYQELKVGEPFLLNFQSSGLDEYRQPKFINKTTITRMGVALAARLSKKKSAITPKPFIRHSHG